MRLVFTNKITKIVRVNKKILRIVFVLLVMAGLLGFGGFYYVQYQKLANNPTEATAREAKNLVKSVSRHIILPNETPTIGTVEDKTKLNDRAFFVDSRNGDKILLYTKAQKAIIYRVSEDRIINVGPIIKSQNSSGINKS